MHAMEYNHMKRHINNQNLRSYESSGKAFLWALPISKSSLVYLTGLAHFEYLYVGHLMGLDHFGDLRCNHLTSLAYFRDWHFNHLTGLAHFGDMHLNHLIGLAHFGDLLLNHLMVFPISEICT